MAFMSWTSEMSRSSTPEASKRGWRRADLSRSSFNLVTRGAARSWAGTRSGLFACALTVPIALATLGPCSGIELKVVEESDPAVTTIILTGKVDAGDGLKVRGFVSGLPAGNPVVARLAFGGGVL